MRRPRRRPAPITPRRPRCKPVRRELARRRRAMRRARRPPNKHCRLRACLFIARRRRHAKKRSVCSLRRLARFAACMSLALPTDRHVDLALSRSNNRVTPLQQYWHCTAPCMKVGGSRFRLPTRAAIAMQNSNSNNISTINSSNNTINLDCSTACVCVYICTKSILKIAFHSFAITATILSRSAGLCVTSVHR